MQKIKASCPICGDQELDPGELDLVLYDLTPELNFYTFVCHDCDERVVKPADLEIVMLLAETVIVQRVAVPAEIMEEHFGPALNIDDLLDLMLEMESL